MSFALTNHVRGNELPLPAAEERQKVRKSGHKTSLQARVAIFHELVVKLARTNNNEATRLIKLFADDVNSWRRHRSYTAPFNFPRRRPVIPLCTFSRKRPNGRGLTTSVASIVRHESGFDE